MQPGCVEEIVEDIVKHKILDGDYETLKESGFNELRKGFKRRMESGSNVITPDVLKKVCSNCKGGKTSAYLVVSYGVLKCFAKSNAMMRLLSKLYMKLIQNLITLK